MAQDKPQSGDKWTSLPVQCKEGLILNMDALTQGTTKPGSAKILQNFECALEGGYRRISGYTKWDSATVSGSGPILGVKAALGGVFAARLSSSSSSAGGSPLGLLLSVTTTGSPTPSNDIYFSQGAGWRKINTSDRLGAITRVRIVTYSITTPVIVGCDGVNTAFRYDGITYTDLNGTGAPSNPQFAEMFMSRLVLAGHTSATSIIISAPNADSDFNAANGAIEINVGDVIMGIKNFRNTLYIFGLNRLYKLTGSSVTDFAIQPVTNSIGCINGDTIQEVGGDLIYLAPDGFRSVAGTYNIGDVDLSLQSRNIQPLIRSLVFQSDHQFPSCVIRKKSQYRCWFYDPTVGKSSTIGVIGKIEQGEPLNAFNYIYTTYAWSTMLGMQPYCADSYWDSNLERVVIGDPANGYVYQLESGSDFDGTPIQAIYQSPYLTFSDATIRKVMQKATIYTQVEGAATINLGVKFDFENSGIIQPPTNTLVGNGVFPVYGSAVYNTDLYSGIQFPVFKQNLVGSGFTTAFSFTSNGGAPYRIDSFQITFAPKGRR